MDKLRVGSIGIGGISTYTHLPGIANCPDLELKAVCDIKPERLEYARKKYNLEEKYCFTNFEDLINCPEVDVIDISTPNFEHFRIAMAAIKAGKSFAVEKPMTMNAKEADTLAKAAKEAGVKSMVCFSYRYKAAARYAKDLIARGLLGDIYHVDMQYYQAWGLPCYDTPRAWRFDKKRTGSGALGDLGSHALDLVRFVTGADYTKLVGHTRTFTDKRIDPDTNTLEPVDVDDFSNYMADMTNGAAATFRISRYGYGRGNYQYMEVYGSKGALVYQLDLTEGVDTLDVCLDPLGKENRQFVRVPIPEKYKVDQMQCFADVMLGKDDGWNATAEDGAINMHAVDAVIASAEKGVWFDV